MPALRGQLVLLVQPGRPALQAQHQTFQVLQVLLAKLDRQDLLEPPERLAQRVQRARPAPLARLALPAHRDRKESKVPLESTHGSTSSSALISPPAARPR